MEMPIRKLSKRQKKLRYVRQNWVLYLLLVPALVYVILFNIVPMWGIQLAFRKYNMFQAATPWRSISAGEWVGFQFFNKVFSRSDFNRAFANTLIISTYKILFTFPAPILFAILLNEFRSRGFQRVVQTVVYMPHFLSWTVVAAIFISILNSTGIVNQAITALGGKKILFLMDKTKFRGILVVSSIWKELGWNSVIYFAAIAGLDQELFEAARVDGANRFQQILHVTIPGLLPTIALMLIMRIGGLMDAGFVQILPMYNSTVMSVADIIGTYVYRLGLGKMDFNTGTAVGLFSSVIGFILVVSSNAAAKKMLGKSIW